MSVNGDLLPEPVWMATPYISSHHGDYGSHAVRGDYTLCGVAVQNRTWVPLSDLGNDVVIRQCGSCSLVPPGHATSGDIIGFGVTYRQLDYWCRLDWLNSTDKFPGCGGMRFFPPGEVKIARDMARLVNAGIPPKVARDAVRNGGQLAPGVRIVVDEAAA